MNKFYEISHIVTRRNQNKVKRHLQENYFILFNLFRSLSIIFFTVKLLFFYFLFLFNKCFKERFSAI